MVVVKRNFRLIMEIKYNLVNWTNVKEIFDESLEATTSFVQQSITSTCYNRAVVFTNNYKKLWQDSCLFKCKNIV